MGIHHIEDLSKSELNKFVCCWNNNLVTITEKIDGSFLSFGLNDKNNFFISTKNLVFKNYNNIPNIFFYDTFKAYFKVFCEIPIENIFLKLEKQYNVSLPRVFEGEMVPHHEHNIVVYDKNKILNGTYVLFKTFEKHNDKLWNDIVNQFNLYSTIKFFILPKINLNCSIKINEDENINNIKNKLMEAIIFNPLFGNDYEGVVIEYDNNFVKLVDKNKFNIVKTLNWDYINRATKLKTQFKNKTKKI